MAIPILKTKLFVPPLRQALVARPLLLARLDGVHQRPFALISAPAGFGKTTLVAEWLKEKAEGKRQKAEILPSDVCLLPFTAAWLSLEESDNDPVRFLRYVTAALQTAVPDLPDDVTALLEGQTGIAATAFLTDLLNAVTAVSQPIILVLDDYHLIQDETIHSGIAFLSTTCRPIYTSLSPQGKTRRYPWRGCAGAGSLWKSGRRIWLSPKPKPPNFCTT